MPQKKVQKTEFICSGKFVPIMKMVYLCAPNSNISTYILYASLYPDMPFQHHRSYWPDLRHIAMEDTQGSTGLFANHLIGFLFGVLFCPFGFSFRHHKQ